MTSTEAPPRKILPPPVGTILLFAADGLSVRKREFSSSGKPRPPERNVWVPKLWQYLESPEGLRTLKELAEAGIRGGNYPDVYLECVDAAFRDPRFYKLAITALEEFADTARERFALPEPTQHAAAGPRPRPETVKPESPKLESPTPSRPRPRRRGPHLSPG